MEEVAREAEVETEKMWKGAREREQIITKLLN